MQCPFLPKVHKIIYFVTQSAFTNTTLHTTHIIYIVSFIYSPITSFTGSVHPFYLSFIERIYNIIFQNNGNRDTIRHHHRHCLATQPTLTKREPQPRYFPLLFHFPLSLPMSFENSSQNTTQHIQNIQKKKRFLPTTTNCQ